MAAVLSHRRPLLVKIPNLIQKPSKEISLHCHQLAGSDSTQSIVSSLCVSLRKNLNWETLTRKYALVDMNDTIAESVLLQFKEPVEAKRALGFFHWVSHSKNVIHGIRAYCIAIHILSRARHTKDASALLDSILLREREGKNDDPSRFLIVDMLLSTYKLANSCPFVFDLLVQRYSKLRMFETAFDVCCYLGEHGFFPSLVSFNTLLHVVQKSSEKRGLIWKVYGYMVQHRIYPNDSTIKIMTSALCKAGALQKFMDILDRIHGKRSSAVVIVNTSLVFRMLEEGRIEEGMVLMKRMLQKNMILDTVCYSLIIYAKVQTGDLDSAKDVYEQMLSRGFNPNPFVYTLFIRAYCENGMVDEAYNLMQEMMSIGLKPYDETYNALILGFANSGNLNESVKMCEEMVKIGLVPSSSSFNEMVRKLCEAGNTKRANALFTLVMENGFVPEETTYCHLIGGYERERNIQEILQLYYEMEHRSISSGSPVFTSLIRSLCECGRLKEAEKYLAVMKSRSLEPNVSIYESLIEAHYEKGNKKRAYCLHHEMVEKGLGMTTTTTNPMIEKAPAKAASGEGEMYAALPLQDGTLKGGCFRGSQL